MNPNDPLSWIEKGDRDLGVVRIILAETTDYSDLVCYHCQQAAEKYLKALQLHFGQPVKKTHILETLLDLLSPFVKIEDELYDKALILQEYAVGIRYPNPFSDPTEEDVKESLSNAESFQTFAKNILGV
jgi:HEPN domain-containing protein